MSDTFSQLYTHIVFAVKQRENLISNLWEEKLYRYITGIVTYKDQKLIAINGMPDHIHILVGIKPTCCISDLVREIKKGTTQYVKEQKLTPFRFQWQEGYGAFSCNHYDLTRIIGYIKNQKEHHKRYNFKEEYIELLREANIDFKEEYVF